MRDFRDLDEHCRFTLLTYLLFFLFYLFRKSIFAVHIVPLKAGLLKTTLLTICYTKCQSFMNGVFGRH